MGFFTPEPEPMAPAELIALPVRDRLRIMTTSWVKDGFNTPRMLHVVYTVKMLGLYFALGLAITAWTSSTVEFTDPVTWFTQIVTYQKLAVWLMFLEVVGLAGAFGPLCGHFHPMLGNIRYWIRPGTIRLAPWGRHLPGTGGDERTVGDVVLYLVVLASLLYPLIVSAVPVTAVPDGTDPQELIPAYAFIPILIVMPLMGLRDKVVFLAARSEQYLPIFLWSAIMGAVVLSDAGTPADFVDLIVIFKIIIVVVWVGAGFAKFGQHFLMVIPPMVSNSPGQPFIVKRAQYRDAPNDIRPSRVAWFMAHIAGTAVEIVVPLVLLFVTNSVVTLIALVIIVGFHIYITSTFPLAVPLEWNVFFGYIAILLWGGVSGGFDVETYSIWHFHNAWLLVPVFALAVVGPVVGNLRPDLISFLPSMRQYSGNWASAVWAMRPGVEERLNDLPLVENQVDQLQRMALTPYTRDEAEVTVQKAVGWRSMHSQGRGILSALFEHLDDIENRTLREGEFMCNTIVGWNFGDGHLHDERLIAAIQNRLDLSPGDLVVAYCESQATPWKCHTPQHYRVIDAALGVVERGTWQVADCVKEQPWLPNGPIPLDVRWTAPGYVRRSTLTGDAGADGWAVL